MALELLAGPFTLSSPLGDSVRIQNSGVTTGWAEGLGLVSTVNIFDGASFVTGGTATLALDGQTFLRGNDLSGSGRYFGADQVGKGLLYQVSAIYPYDPLTNTLKAAIGTAVNHIYRMARLKDGAGERFIRAVASGIETSPDAASATVGWTSEFAGPSLSSFPAFTLCKDGTLVIGCTTGQIVFYDTVAKTRKKDDRHISLTTGLAGIWYSEKHDIFVSLHDYGSNVWKINVWASSVAPTTLSDPIALTEPAKGKVSTMQVQLMGANDDPCVGELIDWTLTGPGALSATQSMTDADGYATVDYIAPLDSLPSFDLEAEARF